MRGTRRSGAPVATLRTTRGQWGVRRRPEGGGWWDWRLAGHKSCLLPSSSSSGYLKRLLEDTEGTFFFYWQRKDTRASLSLASLRALNMMLFGSPAAKGTSVLERPPQGLMCFCDIVFLIVLRFLFSPLTKKKNSYSPLRAAGGVTSCKHNDNLSHPMTLSKGPGPCRRRGRSRLQ